VALIRATRGPGPAWRSWQRRQQLLALIDAENRAEEERAAARLQKEPESELASTEPAPDTEPEMPAQSKREKKGRRTTALTYEAIQRAREDLRLRRGQV
jgi:hypothetical protein